MSADVQLRVSVVGLFVDGDAVLLIHQMTPPEPDCWDLPGGGLHPEEPLLVGLAREIEEETGIRDFQVEGFLAIAEQFFQLPDRHLHSLNLIYRCNVHPRPTQLSSSDAEIGPKGIQWLAIAQLTPALCSSRAWFALQAAGLVERQL